MNYPSPPHFRLASDNSKTTFVANAGDIGSGATPQASSQVAPLSNAGSLFDSISKQAMAGIDHRIQNMTGFAAGGLESLASFASFAFGAYEQLSDPDKFDPLRNLTYFTVALAKAYNHDGALGLVNSIVPVLSMYRNSTLSERAWNDGQYYQSGLADWGAYENAGAIGSALLPLVDLPGSPEENLNLASPRRTRHILVGDENGGDHAYPPAPGKSPFPANWSHQQIMNAVSDVATDPSLTWIRESGPQGSLYTRAGRPARFVVYGQRYGVWLRVVLEPAGEGIITAVPVPGPGE